MLAVSEHVLIDGLTVETRRHVRVVKHEDRPVEITIDGEAVEVLGGSLYRDGGTRVWETTGGRVRLPRRLADRDKPEHLRQPPTLDSEAIGRPWIQDPAEVAAMQRVAEAEGGRTPAAADRSYGLPQTS
jgi:hypothetical protein